MQVGVYYNNNDVRVEERPKPQIGPGELLVKVVASGICGSDVMEWYRIKKAPLVLGHEITGEITEQGDGSPYKIGERVFVSHHVPCLTCHYCLHEHHTACQTLHKTNYDPGGFAEYIRIPPINVKRGVYILPDELSFEDGVFIEPLASVVRAQRLTNIQPGGVVLVIGSGLSGLLHIQLARLRGATKVIATDINEYRLQKAKRFGADLTINAIEDVPSLVRQFNEDRGVDCVIICTGAIQAITQGLRAVDSGGTIIFFAVPEPNIDVPIPINEFWRREIKVITSYGAGPVDILTAIELIRAGRVSVREMVTHRLSLEEIQIGFQIVATALESLKVIIKP